MIRHININIDFLLRKDDKSLARIFSMPGSDVRKDLLQRKAKGEIKIGSERCDGFDPVKGCPGHQNKDFKTKRRNKNASKT